MRIGMLGPISWRTPPRQYGAWETVVSNLTEGLAARGHQVTLFASGDSITRGRLVSVAPRPYSEDENLDPRVWEVLHMAQALEMASEFDILHCHYDFLPLTYSRFISTPLLTTVHGFSLDQYRLAYRAYPNTNFVSISNSDRDPYLEYVATVYNGIRLDEFTFVPDPGEYLVFVGRIHPDKGVHHAVDVALSSGRHLLIAGIIQDQEYFDAKIRPHLSAEIEFVGPVGPAERDQLFGGAWASLHLTTIPERFGLAIAESMATGTPVIGFDRGSVREVVAHGVTGFVVESLDQAVAAVNAIASIDRQACRRRVVEHFSLDAMTEGYLAVYDAVLSRES